MQIVRTWTGEFEQSSNNVNEPVAHRRRARTMTLFASSAPEPQKQEKDIVLEPCVLEVKIRNQVMYVDPPLEYGRLHAISQLHACLST